MTGREADLPCDGLGRVEGGQTETLLVPGSMRLPYTPCYKASLYPLLVPVHIHQAAAAQKNGFSRQKGLSRAGRNCRWHYGCWTFLFMMLCHILYIASNLVLGWGQLPNGSLTEGRQATLRDCRAIMI